MSGTPIATPESPPYSSVRILYATATGTAEDVAHALAQRFTLCGMPVAACAPVDSHTLSSLPTHATAGALFVFVVATAGDGEAPAGMARLWAALRVARLARDALAAVRAAVFGLGDRGYPKFNAAARRLAVRLGDVGAALVTPLALGDEAAAGGYDAALRPWVEALFRAVVPGYDGRSVPSPPPAPAPRLRVTVVAEAAEARAQDGGGRADVGKWRAGQVRRRRRLVGGDERVSVVEAVVAANSVVTRQDKMREEREVRHVELDVSGGGGVFADYAPGDVVHVLPRNRPSAVDAFLTLVDRDPRAVIDVDGEPDALGALNIQTPCALADFAAAQLDLSATPRRRFLERLAAFATDERQRDKLVEFSSADGAESLVQYAHREKRTVLMVLRDFPSARPPLADLIDMIPPLRPRAFSIASSRPAHGSRVHVCAAIVKYTTPLRFARVGVCSSLWLCARVGDVVPVFLERGTLRFDSARPAVLVGPGTGVAPMRSFISSLVGAPAAAAVARVLYFGCRHAQGDFLYEGEWEEAVSDGRLGRVETAFSRDDAERKVYVQDRMTRDAQELWRIVDGDAKGCVYVAGAAGDMPKAVRWTIVRAAMSVGGLSEGDAERYVRRLESTRHLQVECW